MTSIRRHLMLWLLVGLALLLASGGFATYQLVKRLLLDEFDRTLLTRAESLANLLELDLEGLEFSYTDKFMPSCAPDASLPEYFQLFKDGQVFARSPSLREGSLPLLAGPMNSPRFDAVSLPDGRAGRSVGIEFSVHAAPGVVNVLRSLGLSESAKMTVVCCRGTEDLDRALRALASGLLIVGAALGIAVWILVRRAIHSAFQPIVALERRVASLDITCPSPDGLKVSCPSEVDSLRAALVVFVEKIRDAIEREKRITSNIAHELRTPVAELKAITDVARHWPDDLELLRRTVEESTGIAADMERLVDSCLRLARLQSGRATLQLQPVEISELVRALAARVAAEVAERNLAVSLDIADVAPITTDRDLMNLVLGNLIENASSYALEGTWIRVFMGNDAGHAIVRFQNPVETSFSADDVARLAEPFWRRDASRGDGTRLGLGLTLAESACSALRARFCCSVEDEVFTAEVRWPAPFETRAAPVAASR